MKLPTLLILLLHTTLQINAQLAITMPGDFEKNESVVFAWPNQENQKTFLATLINDCWQQVDTVYIMVDQWPTPTDTNVVLGYIQSLGTMATNMRCIPANYTTSLIRNYGPYSGYASFGGDLERFYYDAEYTLSYNPDEDSIPAQLAHYMSWPLADIPLEMNGGNVIHDGILRGFSTSAMLDNNPDLNESEVRNLLLDHFNLNQWTFLEPLQYGEGSERKHLDKFMQIVDFETILVSSYPESAADYDVVEQNVSLLQELTDAFGRPYTIYRLPVAPADDGTWPHSIGDEIRTYTNSLIVNNKVIIPSYGIHFYDSTALAVYQMAMPGYEIHQKNISALSSISAGLRNIGLTLPQTHYLRIEHKKITGQQTYQPDMQITCLSKAGELVEEMWIHYKINQDTSYSVSPVYLVCPEHFGVIEGLNPEDTVHYYLEAISSTTTTTYPLSAPEGNFTFWFEVVSQTPEIDPSAQASIYPNPTDGSIRIVLDEGVHAAQLSVYSLSGSLLWQQAVTNHQRINLSDNISTGVYLAKIQWDDIQEITKLIIQ